MQAAARFRAMKAVGTVVAQTDTVLAQFSRPRRPSLNMSTRNKSLHHLQNLRVNPTSGTVTIKKLQLNLLTKITSKSNFHFGNITLITIMHRYSNLLYTTPLHSFQQMMILLSNTPTVYHQRTTSLPKNLPINCRQVIATLNRRNLLLRTTFADE